MSAMWWLHHSSSTIQQLDILSGAPALLAVWSRPNRVDYYGLESGAPSLNGDAAVYAKTFDAPLDADRAALPWQTFLETLHAPNGAALPHLETPQIAVYTTLDRKTRLYRESNGAVYRVRDGHESKLDLPSDVQAFAMAQETGRVVALDSAGMLYLDSGTPTQLALQPTLGRGLMLAIAHAGDAVFASDGRRLVAVDGEGRVLSTAELPYQIGMLACAPDGKSVIASDIDTGVLRAFDGRTLKQTHQRWAIDLIANAQQLQLIADFPPLTASLSALTVGDANTFAFAMSGVVCVTRVEDMARIPAPPTA